MRPVKIRWPVEDVVAICLAQPNFAGVPLLMNGTLITTPTSVAAFPGLERVVSLTSGGNLAGVQYTVTGFDGLNNPVSQVGLAGPNANTVYTTQKFSVVISITPNLTNATTVRVGTGRTGATIWFNSDYFRTSNALACYVAVTATFNYTFQTTFDDPTVVAAPVIITPIDGVTVPTIPTATPMTAATVSILTNYTIPTHSSRILVNSSDATGAATIYFLQQGIK